MEKNNVHELSSVHHTSAPNAPHSSSYTSNSSMAQTNPKPSTPLFKKAKTKSEIHSLKDTGFKGHPVINHRLGDPTCPATPIIENWLKQNYHR